MRRLLVSVLVGTVFTGCAHHQVKVRNDPSITGANGPRAYVYALDDEGHDLSSKMNGHMVTAAAGKWLTEHGYTMVDQARGADTVLTFNIAKRAQNVNANASTQRYNILLQQQSYNMPPITMAEGTVAFEESNDESAANTIANPAAPAIAAFLDKTALMSPPPAASDAEPTPGCRALPAFRITTEKDETVVERFLAAATPKTLGLNLGDKLLSIGGRPPEEALNGKFEMTQKVDVVFEHDGKKNQVSVPMVEVCRGD